MLRWFSTPIKCGIFFCIHLQPLVSPVFNRIRPVSLTVYLFLESLKNINFLINKFFCVFSLLKVKCYNILKLKKKHELSLYSFQLNPPKYETET